MRKDVKSLRGTDLNIVGNWDASSKLIKHARKLESTFDTNLKTRSRVETRKVACSKCGMQFKVKGDKLPTHKVEKHESIWSPETKTYSDKVTTEICEGELVVDGKVKLEEYPLKNGYVDHLNITLKPGDNITAITYFGCNPDTGKFKTHIYEGKIKSILKVTTTYRNVKWMTRYYRNLPKVTYEIWLEGNTKIDGLIRDITIN
jgi:hypothetical protein